MIKTLEDYQFKLDNDPSFSDKSLTKEEVNNLNAIIDSWSESAYEPVLTMLSNHYLVSVPISLIKKIFKENYELAVENINDSIGDTFPREVFMSELLSHMNIQEWPRASDSEEAKNKFYTEFKSKFKQYGIVELTR